MEDWLSNPANITTNGIDSVPTLHGKKWKEGLLDG
jgi:hypothetical protein